MARLPRRSPVSPSSPLPPDRGADALDRRSSASAVDRRVVEDGVGWRDARMRGQPGGPGDLPGGHPAGQEVELDAAIESMLAAGGVDPVTRVRLSEARRAIADAAREQDPDGFEGASLSKALFRFVMPRLRHPEVLRAERHRALLEGLADGLAQTDDDGIVREGALVIHRELRRLALLRTGRNALVEG